MEETIKKLKYAINVLKPYEGDKTFIVKESCIGFTYNEAKQLLSALEKSKLYKMALELIVDSEKDHEKYDQFDSVIEMAKSALKEISPTIEEGDAVGFGEYLRKNRDVINTKKPNAMDRLYPMRGDSTPDRSNVMV